MSRERWFKHGELKSFLHDPNNWYCRHTFPVDAILSIRRQAAFYRFRCSAKWSGCRETRQVTIIPTERSA